MANSGPARHLVLKGHVAAFDIELAQMLATRPWDAATVALAPPWMSREAVGVFAAVLDAIAPSVRTMAVRSLAESFHAIPGEARAWLQLQRLVVRDTQSFWTMRLVSRAALLHTLDALSIMRVDSTARHLVLSVPREFESDLDLGAEDSPLTIKCATIRTRKGVETIEFVVRDRTVYGLIDALPPGLAVLRVSMKCGADWDATIKILLAALQPDRWDDARRPRALELVWTPDRRRVGSGDNPTLAIQASLVPLREQCAARGVDLKVFVEMGGSCRCGARSLSAPR